MTLSDAAAVAGVISSVAVLISLVYLALQVRHASNSQRSETQGNATGRRMEVLVALADAGAAESMCKGMEAAPDMTEIQIHQFTNLCNLTLAMAEDEFFQHRAGLLDDQRYLIQRGILEATLSAPGFRACWRMTRAMLHPDFAAHVDEIMRNAKSTSGDAFFAGFRALAAEERAAAADA